MIGSISLVSDQADKIFSILTLFLIRAHRVSTTPDWTERKLPPDHQFYQSRVRTKICGSHKNKVVALLKCSPASGKSLKGNRGNLIDYNSPTLPSSTGLETLRGLRKLGILLAAAGNYTRLRALSKGVITRLALISAICGSLR